MTAFTCSGSPCLAINHIIMDSLKFIYLLLDHMLKGSCFSGVKKMHSIIGKAAFDPEKAALLYNYHIRLFSEQLGIQLPVLWLPTLLW